MIGLHPDETRVLGMAAPSILRMLKVREERLITRMYGDFRAGKHEQTAALAELACLRELTRDINQALQTLNQETQS